MRIDLEENIRHRIILGRVGDNDTTPIQFDARAWESEYGDGTLNLVAKRNGDAEPYPVLLEYEAGVYTWTPTDADTAYAGSGEAQLIYTVDGKIKKTAIYSTEVFPSLIPSSADPYQPYSDWLEQMIAEATNAAQSAENASESARSAAESASDVSALVEVARGYADSASTSEANALTSEANASASADRASSKAEDARQSALSAQASASGASQSAQFAQSSATTASNSATRAGDRATRAETAQGLAETAAATATSAADRAESAAEAAESVFTFTDSGEGNIIIARGND